METVQIVSWGRGGTLFRLFNSTNNQFCFLLLETQFFIKSTDCPLCSFFYQVLLTPCAMFCLLATFGGVLSPLPNFLPS